MIDDLRAYTFGPNQVATHGPVPLEWRDYNFGMHSEGGSDASRMMINISLRSRMQQRVVCTTCRAKISSVRETTGVRRSRAITDRLLRTSSLVSREESNRRAHVMGLRYTALYPQRKTNGCMRVLFAALDHAGSDQRFTGDHPGVICVVKIASSRINLYM